MLTRGLLVGHLLPFPYMLGPLKDAREAAEGRGI